MRAAAEGTRNETLNKLAFRADSLVAAGFITESEARELIAAAMDTGLAQSEADKSFASGFAAGLQHPAEKTERPGYSQSASHEDGGEAQEPLHKCKYRMTERGLFMDVTNAKGEVKSNRVTSTPFEVLGLGRRQEQKSWAVVISWSDQDNMPHTEIIPNNVLHGDGKELARLVDDAGLLVKVGGAALKHLAIYLDIQRQNEKKRIWIADTCGWQHDDTFRLPNGEAIGKGSGEQIMFTAPSDTSVTTAGCYDAWRDGVAHYTQGNPLLAFALGCAFAPPLLHLLGLESGGFHFWGASSIGKSTVIRVAWGVWGNPIVLSSWRTTANGIEARAASTNDFLLVLDDSKQADAATIERVIYLLANQTGKGRMDKTCTLARTMTFRNIVLSTGESDFQFELERRKLPCDGGLDVRLAGINAEHWAYGAFNDTHKMANGADFAESIKRTACANYGWAGRDFLGRLCCELVNDRDGFIKKMHKRHSDWIESFCPSGCDGQVRRVAARFALVAVAAGLAIEWGILEAGTDLAVVEIFQAWIRDRRGVGSHEAQIIVENVKNFILYEGQKYLVAPGPKDEAQRTCNLYGLRVPREHCKDCDYCHCKDTETGDSGACVNCGKPMQTDCPNGSRCKYFDYWLAGKTALQEASKRPFTQTKKALIAAGIMEPMPRKWPKSGWFHGTRCYVILGDKLIAPDANGDA